MTGPEAGYLLLCCHLGNPDRKVLTTAQLRTLSQRMQNLVMDDPNRELEASDLLALGYSREMAQRILSLLSEKDLLRHYLRRAAKAGCVPIVRISPMYPARLRQQLGDEAPGCLWARGDPELLKNRCISLVGSRDLNPANLEFAREAGSQAARQGYTLVSGNARGADRNAQDACLTAGGNVISIVADSLESHPLRPNVLYLSEDDFGAEFSAQRALSRNRCIHAMSDKVLVAQSGFQHGGTWDGTVKNLRFHWSQVFCFGDRSPAAEQLCLMGANPVTMEDLSDLNALFGMEVNFFSR